MNVLVLNTCFRGGGAEAIARTVYEGLQQFDSVNCFFVSGMGPLEDENRIYPNCKSKMVKDIRLKCRMIYRKNILLPFFWGELRHDRYSTKWLIDFIQKNKIDILHINNIHGAFLGIYDIQQLSQYCKIVWTLHDMWAFTGHCVYALDCEKWILGDCSNCPRPKLMNPISGNRSKRSLKDKGKIFTNANITYVPVSKWMLGNMKKGILSHNSYELIYNGVETDVYIEKDRNVIRKSFDVNEKDFVLLFIANDLNSPFKGMDVLVEALKRIDPDVKEKITLLICGNGKNIDGEICGYKTIYTGYVSDGELMSDIYNVADLFVVPSKAENCPCVVLESLACGTPVIGSTAGGISELITDETGWLFKNGDYNELKQIIEKVVSDYLCGECHNDVVQMRKRCRERAMKFDASCMIQSYKALFEKLCE